MSKYPKIVQNISKKIFKNKPSRITMHRCKYKRWRKARAMYRLFSSNLFGDNFIQKTVFRLIKLIHFRGDLTDILAKTATLAM